jgi:hypothetical protein
VRVRVRVCVRVCLSARSCVDDTSFVFVSSHLAAHLEHVQARNQNLRQTLKVASLGNADLDFDCQFHHVIWLGDLNYRIDLRHEIGACVRKTRVPAVVRGCWSSAHACTTNVLMWR